MDNQMSRLAFRPYGQRGVLPASEQEMQSERWPGPMAKKRETLPSETDVGLLSHISDLATGGSECRHCFCEAGRKKGAAYSVTGLIDPD